MSSNKCDESKNSHKYEKRNNKKLEKFEKLDKLKVRDLCVKRLNTVDIKSKTIEGVKGIFDNLIVENSTINNLHVTSINGTNVNCDNSRFNIIGTITPVQYINGVPQQPVNQGNFNQSVLNDLWDLNLLANVSTNLDADSGRLRNAILSNFYGCTGCPAPNLSNCLCPIPGYAVFTGSIASNTSGATGTILKVTAMSNESFTDCLPNIGTIEIGQTIFLQNTNQTLLNSTIIAQISGVTGGVGTYLISNNFNDYSQNVPSQKMLSLSNLTINDCVNTPLRIYGVETLPVSQINGNCPLNIISAIAYNLNIVNKTLDTKIAAVYVQVGWQVPQVTGATGTTNVQGISIDTRQFDPSILSFGEQMNNNVLLPTDLINSIAVYNMFTNFANAVVQLVVYVEDGLEVIIPESGSAINSSSSVEKKATTKVVQNVGSNFAAAYDSGDVGIVLAPIPIPENAKTMRFNAFGGGGGGGGGTNYFYAGGGGGGGSGHPLNETGQEIIINLTQDAFRTMNVILGRGGPHETDGGTTTITLIGLTSTASYAAQGGKAGSSASGLFTGKGGDGYFGGGSGGKVGSYINNGGSGSQGSPCADGTDGGSITGDGGDGGYITCGQGGQGGAAICIENCGGGGGGGGLGGGDGGNGYGAGRLGDEALNGNDASGKASGGGGAGYSAKLGGKGGDGYIDGPYFTF